MTRPRRRPAARRCRQGFTLIEILLASFAAAMILLAIYGVFSRAVRMRDHATQRAHEARLRARAERLIRNDLRNAWISGGVLASTLAGDSHGTDAAGTGAGAGFPGYLKLTTTTGKDTADDLFGDVQQVEYYIVRDSQAADQSQGGTLVRAVNRDLLASVPPALREERILTGVQSLQVAFYDGADWRESWQVQDAAGGALGPTGAGGDTDEGPNLPVAIRIAIQPAPPSPRDHPPAPLEILVPWPTQPFAGPAPAASDAPSPSPGP